MQPSEFWNLSSTEFWWEFDVNARTRKANEKGIGGHSKLEWELAWQKHKRKQRGNADNPL